MLLRGVGVRWCGGLLGLLGALGTAGAQGPGTVASAVKISDTTGGFLPALDTNDQLGRSIALLGDVDGDGVADIASSGHADDDGGLDRGATYVLFLRRDGRVKATQKISLLQGGFSGPLRDGDQMGRAATGLGDLDGDGVPDLALGANFDDEGGQNSGAVWILFLERNGTVKRQAKIFGGAGGVRGLEPRDEFGRALAGLGDFDGDGIPDLAVSAPYDDDGGGNKGALYLLFLERDGRVKDQRKISQTQGGFRGRLRANDLMGFSLCNLGDFDGNGVVDLVAGAVLDDDGALNAGAIWLLFLRPDGTVLREQKISALAGGFTGVLESPDQFGDAVAAVGDLDGDGRTEIAVGAVKDGDGGKERGGVWILFPNADGTVAFHQKISHTSGNLPYRLDNVDWFGSALSALGDLDGDGVPDLAIGARNDDDGGSNHGALYMAFLRGTVGNQAMVAGAGAGDAAAGSALRLVAGAPAPGERLGLLAQVPVGAGSSTALLLAGHARAGAPRHLLALSAQDGLGPTGAEFVLSLPADPALAGERLWLQVLWVGADGRPRARSQLLELQL